MIKNENQLEEAIGFLNEIIEQLKELRSEFSDDPLLDMYVLPLMDQKFQTENEIKDFLFLTNHTFQQGIDYLSNQELKIENISDLLAKLRISAKLTQADLAEKIGWEQSNISRFESENYSSQTINKISEFLSGLGIELKVAPLLSEQNLIKRSSIRRDTLMNKFDTWDENFSHGIDTPDSVEKDWLIAVRT